MEGKEIVLLVPKRLGTKAYTLLIENNLVPRKYHLEGRYGSRTHVLSDGLRVGIPLVESEQTIELLNKSKEKNDGEKCEALIGEIMTIDELFSIKGVDLEYRPITPPRVPRQEPCDARVHPERQSTEFPSIFLNYLQSSNDESEYLLRGNDKKKNKTGNETNCKEGPSTLFTFCELFAGIGGFGYALESLGGKCVCASEISQSCIDLFLLNNRTLDSRKVHGDIWELDTSFLTETTNSKSSRKFDLLVGGFPCQPFSTLGNQPGLSDKTKEPSRLKNKNKRAKIDPHDMPQQKLQQEEMMNKNEDMTKNSGRGQLYTQIVRILNECNPKAFLLENVPGLITTANGKALEIITKELENAGDSGYCVYSEVITSRGLTAQARKRLYFVGFSKTLPSMTKNDDNKNFDEKMPFSFEFPFIPDLGLRMRDVLHSSEELLDEHEQLKKEVLELERSLNQQNNEETIQPTATTSYRNHQEDKSYDDMITIPTPTYFHLTPNQMHHLQTKSKKPRWVAAHLAWEDNVARTLNSHYGTSVGRGTSQLVPSEAPHRVRKFTPRECARIMGFADTFLLVPLHSSRKKNTSSSSFQSIHEINKYLKDQYCMFGNAVTPPVIAAIASAILSKCDIQSNHNINWVEVGRLTSCHLALKTVKKTRINIVKQRLIQEWKSSFEATQQTTLQTSLQPTNIIYWKGICGSSSSKTESRVGLEMQEPWGTLLLKGKKTIETRAYTLPKQLIGKVIHILQSRKGKDGISSLPNVMDYPEQKVDRIGWVVFDHVVEYRDKESFIKDEQKHLVLRESNYAWKDGETKVIYGWKVKECGGFEESSRSMKRLIRRMRSLFEIEFT